MHMSPFVLPLQYLIDQSINQSMRGPNGYGMYIYNVSHTKRKYIETESELSSAVVHSLQSKSV